MPTVRIPERLDRALSPFWHCMGIETTDGESSAIWRCLDSESDSDTEMSGIPRRRKSTKTILYYAEVCHEGRWGKGRAVCWDRPPLTNALGMDYGTECSEYIEARGFISR